MSQSLSITRHGSASTMSCSLRSTARKRCLGISSRTWELYSTLARRKECKIEQGHLRPDHVHILISIPPKHSVASVIGFLKGKSSIWIGQNVERKARNFLVRKFWARGYFVSTIGRNKEMTCAYIKNPEMADKLQLKLASHKVQSLVPESFITAFGGSHSNPQLCWGLLIGPAPIIWALCRMNSDYIYIRQMRQRWQLLRPLRVPQKVG